MVSNSGPHATDMGRVESEPAFVYYSSNHFHPLLGFKSHHHGPRYLFHHMYVEFTSSFFTLWMIYCMVVVAAPYPGYEGCFMTHGNGRIVYLWAILMVWDAGRCQYVIPFPSNQKHH